MKFSLIFIAAAFLAIASTARAGLVGVDEIIVYSHDNTWLQIAEVIATGTGTGSDVALATNGTTATATSNYAATDPASTIDGAYPASYPNIWHSGSQNGHDYLDAIFATAAELDSISIWGRGDGYSDRDLYDVYLYNSSHTLLFTELGADARTAGFVTFSLPSTNVPEPTGLVVFCVGIFALWRKRLE